MQFTMSMIVDALSDFRTESSFSQDAEELNGLRLGPETINSGCVHLIQNGPDVLCINRGDRILVFETTIEKVFNVISNLTERLQFWEDSLNEILYSGGTLQELVNLGSRIVNNPVFVVDQREIVFAMSDHPAGSVDSEWDYMLEYGRMPLYRVSAIYHESDIKNIRRGGESYEHPFIFQPPGTNHRGITCRIPDPVIDSFLGTMVIIENQSPLTDGLLHLSRTIVKAIVKWTKIHENDHNMKNISHLFVDMLNNELVDEEEIAIQKSLYGMQNDTFFLMIIPPKNGLRLRYVGRVLETEMEHTHCFEYKGELLALCSRDPADNEMTEKLYSLADDLQIRIGISYPFTDWRALKSAYKQANIALDYCPGNVCRLSSDSVLNYLISELSTSLHDVEIAHPALKILREYDRLHSTRYFETLHAYLKCERNLVKTSAALFIHRNSLVYRIARIQELIDVDLDDHDVRSYVMLSYLCQAEKQHRLIDNIKG